MKFTTHNIETDVMLQYNETRIPDTEQRSWKLKYFSLFPHGLGHHASNLKDLYQQNLGQEGQQLDTAPKNQ